MPFPVHPALSEGRVGRGSSTRTRPGYAHRRGSGRRHGGGDRELPDAFGMTWVFGTATEFFGTAICVSDIQVTLPGDETVDCLQKMYPLAQNVVAGFAGDVELGFSMLEDLAAIVQDERPRSAHEAMGEFSRIAKARFARLLVGQQERGSEVLMAYVLPNEQMVYGGQPLVGRFRCPDFEFEEIPRGAWGSIGSGTDIPAYQRELEKLTGEQTDPLLQMEANQPGGYAQMMFIALTGAIGDIEPIPGISRHFHSCVVTVGGYMPGNSDRTMFGPDGEIIEIKMPKVATSFAELQELLRAGRQDAPASAIA
jgi:hypothetical protein